MKSLNCIIDKLITSLNDYRIKMVKEYNSGDYLMIEIEKVEETYQIVFSNIKNSNFLRFNTRLDLKTFLKKIILKISFNKIATTNGGFNYNIFFFMNNYLQFAFKNKLIDSQIQVDYLLYPQIDNIDLFEKEYIKYIQEIEYDNIKNLIIIKKDFDKFQHIRKLKIDKIMNRIKNS